MNTALIYKALLGLVLVIIVVFFFFGKKNRQEKRLTPLTGLAFALIIAGIVFGDNQALGYALIGSGLILGVIDIFRKPGKL